MAEIRANCEYQFKEFHISEEIAKNPPTKAKRWTYRDFHPNNRFYARSNQRPWDEQGFGKWSNEINTGQQYIKHIQKPESHLRAEFFNAYKKYYRRVDIKRLEVQSTLNVDAKYTTTDEAVEGESSLYKEKECMEINIVLDTEQDDAMVSGKVRRTVLSVPYGDEGGETSSKEVVRINDDEEKEKHFRNYEQDGINDNKHKVQTEDNETNLSNQYLHPTSLIHDSQKNCRICPENPNVFEEKCFNPEKNNMPIGEDRKHPARSTYRAHAEKLGNINDTENEEKLKKTVVELNKVTTSNSETNFENHDSLRTNLNHESFHITDPSGSCSDSSGSLEISESKYADVWGSSLATLENENKQRDFDRDCQRRPKTPFGNKNSKYVRIAKKSQYNSEKQSYSNKNLNLPSCSRANPSYIPSTALKSFRNEKSQFNNNFKNSEFLNIHKCAEEETSETYKKNYGHNSPGQTYRNSKAADKPHFNHKVHLNNQKNCNNMSSHSKFSNRNGLQSNSEKVDNVENLQDHYNIAKCLEERILNSESLKENKLSEKSQESKVNLPPHSRTESIEDSGNSHTTKVQPDNHATRICSGPSGIKIRGMRGIPFNKTDTGLLPSLVINVTQNDNGDNLGVHENENVKIIYPQCSTKVLDRNQLFDNGNSERKLPCYVRPSGTFCSESETSPRTHKFLNSYESGHYRSFKKENEEAHSSRDEISKETGGSQHSNSISDCSQITKSRYSDAPLLSQVTREVKPYSPRSNDNTKSVKILRKHLSALSDNDTEIKSDYNTYSTLQSSSDWHSLHETSESSKNPLSNDRPQGYCNNSISSEMFESTYSDEEYKSDLSNYYRTQIKGKENLQDIKTEMQFNGKHRSSKMTPDSKRQNGDLDQRKIRISASKPCPCDCNSYDVLERNYAEPHEPLQPRQRRDDQFSNPVQQCSHKKVVPVPKTNDKRERKFNTKKWDMMARSTDQPNGAKELGSNYQKKSAQLASSTRIQYVHHCQPITSNDPKIEKSELTKQLSKTNSKQSYLSEPYEIHLVYDAKQISNKNVPEETVDFDQTNSTYCPKTSITKYDVVQQIQEDFSKSETCNKKNSKWSNVDCLQIGPTYSLDYSPTVETFSKKQEPSKNYQHLRREEEINSCYCGPSFSDPICHCTDENVTNCQCGRHLNQIYSRKEKCNTCCPNRNFTKFCYNEQLPNSLCNKRTEMNICSLHNSINYHNCQYAEPPFRPSQRYARRHDISNSRKTNSCSCICCDREETLHCYGHCSLTFQQKEYIDSSWTEDNEKCCHGNPFNDTKLQSKEQWPYLNDTKMKTCSVGLCCNYGNQCAIDERRRGGAVCLRNDVQTKCCFGRPERKAETNATIIDNERQWAAAGHQPKKNVPGFCKNVSCENSCLANCKNFHLMEQTSSNGQQTMTTNEELNFPTINECNRQSSVYAVNDTNFNCENDDSNENQKRRNNISTFEDENITCHSNSYEKDSQIKNKCYMESCSSDYPADRGNQNYSTNIENKNTFSVPSDINNNLCHIDEKRPSDDEQTRDKDTFIRYEKNKLILSNHKNEQFGSDNEYPKENKYFQKNKNKVSFVSDQFHVEPRFLSEEKWESDVDAPIRENVGSSRNEEDRKSYVNEPLYLREEQWDTNDQEIRENETRQREENRDHSSDSDHLMDDSTNYYKEQRGIERVEIRRNANNFSRYGDSRRRSSVQGISEPSFHCEEQWASDEEKLVDHSKHTTLPKNRRNWRKGRYRRAFNPKRWDMVTDNPPRNEYIGRQYRPNDGDDTSSYDGPGFGNTLIFNSRKHSHN